MNLEEVIYSGLLGALSAGFIEGDGRNAKAELQVKDNGGSSAAGLRLLKSAQPASDAPLSLRGRSPWQSASSKAIDFRGTYDERGASGGTDSSLQAENDPEVSNRNANLQAQRINTEPSADTQAAGRDSGVEAYVQRLREVMAGTGSDVTGANGQGISVNSGGTPLGGYTPSGPSGHLLLPGEGNTAVSNSGTDAQVGQGHRENSGIEQYEAILHQAGLDWDTAGKLNGAALQVSSNSVANRSVAAPSLTTAQSGRMKAAGPQQRAVAADAEEYAQRLQEVMPELGMESGLVGMGSKFAAEKKQMGHEDGKALDSPEWKEISVAGGKTNTKYRMQKNQKTIEQEVMLTNPGYKNGGPEYRQNCQRCVAAYVMRKRGYDVIAKPAVVDENGELSSKDPMSKKWKHIFVDTDFQFYTGYDGGKEEIISQMSKWEEGAVAEIRVMWDSKHAHVFVAEKVGGAIRFLDPQKGACNCEHYFTDAIIGGTMMARIDGHEPTELIELCIMNRGGRE